jgi:hypothetical protein
MRGKNQIDYILVSQTILLTVQNSGVPSHHSLLHGSHRPYFIDLDAVQLFSNLAHDIAPIHSLQLRLQGPWIVTAYIEGLHKQLGHHNVLPRIENLKATLSGGAWKEDHVKEYEAIDMSITEAMLYTEKQVGRQIMQTFQWTPKLKQVVQKIRYWSFRLWQVHNQPILASQPQHIEQHIVSWENYKRHTMN